MRPPSNDSARNDDTNTNTDTDTDRSDPQRSEPQSFGQRHGLKIMAVIMGLMFATVIFAQVAC